MLPRPTFARILRLDATASVFPRLGLQLSGDESRAHVGGVRRPAIRRALHHPLHEHSYVAARHARARRRRRRTDSRPRRQPPGRSARNQ